MIRQENGSAGLDVCVDSGETGSGPLHGDEREEWRFEEKLVLPSSR